MFLDDLQWADAPSLKLLELLLTEPESEHLFVMGAYRDDEVDDAHPLTAMLDGIERGGGRIGRVHLAPLTVDDVGQLVLDTFRRDRHATAELAGLVHAKTGGNPFFVREFVRSLADEKLVRFEPVSDAVGAARVWRWDLAAISARDITDNIVELIADKAKQLEADTQTALKMAACLGNRFELRILAMVMQTSAAATARALASALDAGLVLPLSESYRLMDQDVPGLAESVQAHYRFSHDRVQQAVYALNDPDARAEMHHRIGHLLVADTAEADLDRRVFDILQHLNAAAELIKSDDERAQLVDLNLRACRRAKQAAAYEPSNEYVEAGLRLARPDDWQTRYDVMLALHAEGVETAYLANRPDRINILADALLANAKTLLDKVIVYEVRIQAFASQNKLWESIRTALEGLALLGLKLPEKPGQPRVMTELLRTKTALARTNTEALAALPELSDPVVAAQMRLMFKVLAAAYLASPNLLAVAVLRMVSLSTRYGASPAVAFSYSAYGLLMCGALGQMDLGHRFGELAITVMERLGAATANSDWTNVWFAHHHSIVLGCLFGKHEEALSAAERAREHMDASVGLLEVAHFYFYEALSCVAVARTGAPNRGALLRRAWVNQQRLAYWTRYCPENFEQLRDLIAAERHRTAGRVDRARAAYDDAIQHAQNNGYPNIAALGRELAAAFHFDQGVEHLGQYYAREARQSYAMWGAVAKANHVVARFPMTAAALPGPRGRRQTISATTTDRTGNSQLDLVSIVRATRVLSGEIVFDEVVRKLMTLVFETAGAEEGCLILPRDDAWLIESGDAAGQRLDESDAVPRSVVAFVTRTGEPVVIDDVATDPRFGNEPWFVQRQPKAVLCVPLLNQGTVTGVLYLQNKLTAGAFTADRIEVLNILSAQAAVSIANARLYEEQVAMNRAASTDTTPTARRKSVHRSASVSA